MLKNYFSQLLNARRVSDVRWKYVHLSSQAGGETLRPKVHKCINSVWNKKELPDQLKELIIIPVCKKGDKPGCGNCRRISLLSTLYKILSSILLSTLRPYVSEIIGNRQCWFRRNKSTINQISLLQESL
jgi:hypothetical protein